MAAVIEMAVVAAVPTDAVPTAAPRPAFVAHPAAEVFPTLIRGPKFDALVADIAAHGLARPITRTPFGAILDGRARLRACQAAGVTPRFAVFVGDPWRFAITTHGPKLATNNAKAMAAARIAASTHVTPGPPNARQVQRLIGISVGSMGRARRVVRTGTAALIAATRANLVPLTTAARVAELTAQQQDRFVGRVRGGELPRHIARPGWRGEDAPPEPNASISRRQARYRYVQEPALRVIGDSLDGLAMVLASADGLDPALTPEQAAAWRSDLSRRAKSFRQLMGLLKERSE